MTTMESMAHPSELQMDPPPLYAREPEEGEPLAAEEVEGPWPESPPTYQDAMGGPALLTYRDFLPSPSGSGKCCKYESFSTVMKKANNWLTENSNLKVCSCEVLKLKRSEKRINCIDPDAATSLEYLSFRKSYITGLRVWLLPKSYDDDPTGQRLGVYNVVPRCVQCGENQRSSRKRSCRYQNLREALEEFNQMNREFPLQGKIVSVHTDARYASYNEHVIDIESTFWMESRQLNVYANIIRVFYIMGQPCYQTLDYKNFKPVLKKAAKNIFDRDEFEKFSIVGARAREWVTNQFDISVINVQSVDCKVRRQSLSRAHDQKVCDPDRTFYDEKGGKNATAMLRVVRVFYTRKDPLWSEHLPPLQTVTHKTFKPCQLVEGDMLITIDSYEDLLQTKNRMKSWLRAAGVDSRQILSAETVPVMLYDGVQDGDAEEMLKYHRSDTIRMVLNVIRVYIKGTYVEPPVSALPPQPVIKKRKNAACSLS